MIKANIWTKSATEEVTKDKRQNQIIEKKVMFIQRGVNFYMTSTHTMYSNASLRVRPVGYDHIMSVHL